MVEVGTVYSGKSEYLKNRDFKDCDPVDCVICGTGVDDYEGDLAIMLDLNFGVDAAGEDIVKKWRLNNTNARNIEMIVGSSETDDWIGAAITLAWDPTVEYPKGTRVGGLRVQVPIQNTGKKAAFLTSKKAQAPAESENPAEGLDDEIPF